MQTNLFATASTLVAANIAAPYNHVQVPGPPHSLDRPSDASSAATVAEITYEEARRTFGRTFGIGHPRSPVPAEPLSVTTRGLIAVGRQMKFVGGGVAVAAGSLSAYSNISPSAGNQSSDAAALATSYDPLSSNNSNDARAIASAASAISVVSMFVCLAGSQLQRYGEYRGRMELMAQRDANPV